MGHETLWIATDLRKTALSRRDAFGRRGQRTRGRPAGAGGGGLGVSVAAGLAAGGRGGLGRQAGPGGSPPGDRPTTRAVAAAAPARSPRGWLPQRTVDGQAHGCGDAGALWGARPSGARLED